MTVVTKVSRLNKFEDLEKPVCPYCKNDNVQKLSRSLRRKGWVRQWHCLNIECAKYFTILEESIDRPDNDDRPKCIGCNSTNTRKFGTILTRKEGLKQRWNCRDCQKNFTLPMNNYQTKLSMPIEDKRNGD